MGAEGQEDSPRGTAAPRELALDPEGRIAEDLPCRACGYNLRGQALAARCPECALAVSLSARSDLLRFSDPEWIGRLVKGMRLILIGLIVGVAIQIGAAVAGVAMATAGAAIWTSFLTAAMFVGGAVAVIVVVGVWMLTTPEPTQLGTEPPASARRLARWCLTVQIATTVLQLSSSGNVGVAGPPAPAGGASTALAAATIVLVIVVMIGYGAGFVYLRRLALRGPMPSLARHTRIVMWGYLATQGLGVALWVLFLFALNTVITPAGPVVGGTMVAAAVGGCAVALGSLVFGIWGLVLLLRYAALFKGAAAAARETWHPAPA
jgi:hypothetical protein